MQTVERKELTATIFAASDFSYVDLLRDELAQAFEADQFSEIKYWVYKKTSEAATPTVVSGYDGLSIDIGATVFDTLQTVPGTNISYNFLHTVPAAALVGNVALFRIEYRFTRVDGGQFYQAISARPIRIYSAEP